MLIFKEYKYENVKELVPYILKSPYQCSDLSLGYLAMWKEELSIQYAIWNDTVIIQQDINDQAAFSYPFGKNPDGMLDELIAYVIENHLPLRFFGLDENHIHQLKQDSRFQTITYNYDIRWSDYIYDAAKASTFSGKKFAGQRNHVNKYKKLYGDPEIVALTPELVPQVLEMLHHYKEEHQDANALEKIELERTIYLLHHFQEFHQSGACLFYQGQIIAFSIGEVIGDMLIIHVEKALRSYEGVYPVMYQGFVCLMMQQYPNLVYVNREDDSGDPGLRTSKMQYQPISRIHKYFAHMNSPIEQVSWQPIVSEHLVLTKMEERDCANYYALNTDEQMNRWWGYDYLDDVNITSPIEENTFYDYMLFDMSVGDSINFAIRETEDGPLIGEVILWNFTHSKQMEIGCRLFPDYHGKGYGNEAFLAAVNYAEQVLHYTVFARCFLENEASYKMILHSGLQECAKDETYYYFKK